VNSRSLREALGTPESVRTATHDRSPLGSRALSRPLNVAEAPSRLTLSARGESACLELPRCASDRSRSQRRQTDSPDLMPVHRMADVCARSDRAVEPEIGQGVF